MREENEYLKDQIDVIRGFLMTTYLLPGKEEGYCKNLTYNNLDKLLRYLRATGDFKQEIRKLNTWKEFLMTRTKEEISSYLEIAITFADFFETRSQLVLGKYTINVEKYLNETHHEHRWKEDIIFCGRKEVEYHLNMVGAEIMTHSK